MSKPAARKRTAEAPRGSHNLAKPNTRAPTTLVTAVRKWLVEPLEGVESLGHRQAEFGRGRCRACDDPSCTSGVGKPVTTTLRGGR